MKRLFVWFCLLSLTCCKNRSKEDEGSTRDTTITTNRYSADDYANYIQSLDTTNVTSISAAAKQFNEMFAGADSSVADNAFVHFYRLYNKLETYLNEQHIKDTVNYTAFAEGPEVPPAPTTHQAFAYNQKLRKNGFAFALTEGSTYIRKFFDSISHYFTPHLSPQMTAYMQQESKEIKEGFISDGGLVITPTDVAQRILFWEDFLKTYPNFPFKDEVVEKQKQYLTFLLEGVDNTPLLSYQDKELNEFYSLAYQYVLKEHPSSNLAALIRPYLVALDKRNFAEVRKILREYKKKGYIYDYS